MKPTEELMQDHRVIERMCAILKSVAERIDRGQGIPKDIFPRSIDFIRTYADRAHHGKEEENLFPALEKHGLPRDGGPVGVMLEEHQEGRAYVKGIDEAAREIAAGDKAAMARAAQNARGYAYLLEAHIQKEDTILYEMADNVLTPGEQQELSRVFARVEAERMGPERRSEYGRMVEDLEKELGLK